MLDVLIGVFIFIMTVVLLAGYTDHSPSLGKVEQDITTLSTNFFSTPLRSFDFQNNDLALQIDFETYNSLFTADELVAVLCHQDNCDLASDIVGNASSWLSPSVGFSYYLGDRQIYYRPSRLGNESTSSVKLAKHTLTIVTPNLTTELPTNVTTIEVWQ